MEMNILVMFANQYDVDGTRGCTVNYYMLDANGKMPFEMNPTGPIGQQNAKVSMAYEMRDKIVTVPGVYRGKFELVTGSDRKPTLKLVDLDYDDKSDVSVVFGGLKNTKSDK